jgi:hypothetical protein
MQGIKINIKYSYYRHLSYLFAIVGRTVNSRPDLQLDSPPFLAIDICKFSELKYSVSIFVE